MITFVVGICIGILISLIILGLIIYFIIFPWIEELLQSFWNAF